MNEVADQVSMIQVEVLTINTFVIYQTFVAVAAANLSHLLPARNRLSSLAWNLLARDPFPDAPEVFKV